MHRHPVARLAAVLTLAIAGVLAVQSASAVQPAASTVTRQLEPVVVAGSAILELQNAEVENIFVYTYLASTQTWTQIPFQVDERNDQGSFTAAGNGLLGDEDEVVFMAKDLGDAANGTEPTADGELIGPEWYEISVTDPISPTARGYAYVVHAPGTSPDFDGDYAGFDGANRRIAGQNYELGWSVGKSFFDHLSLNDGPDILDRGPKIRACAVELCLLEESAFINGSAFALVKDGSVRVIARGGGVVIGTEIFAYGNMVETVSVVASPVRPDFMRFSFDFNADAVGSVAYNGYDADGDTVDVVNGLGPRSPDNNAPGPYAPAWQLSTATAAIVNVGDIRDIGGTAKTYYADDVNCGTPCTDTGDQKHYGETGVRVDNGSTEFVYPYSIYFVDGRHADLRDTYVARFAQPLAAAGAYFGEPPPPPASTVYLPLVRK